MSCLLPLMLTIRKQKSPHCDVGLPAESRANIVQHHVYNVFIIMFLSTAAITGCPGRCRLSVQYNYHVHGCDVKDVLYLGQ